MKVVIAIFAIIILISLSGVIIDCAGFIGNIFGVMFIVSIIGFILAKIANK